nr:DUF4231 domain-containing protein [Nitrosomonas ureae]
MWSWKPADYVEQRAKQYQVWYPQRSRLSESHLLRMRTAIVLGGVIVSVIVNSALPAKEMLASIISLIVVACAALESVYHYREQWKNYRSTEQFLGREQVFFLTGEGGYKEFKSAQAVFIYFVERCEKVRSKQKMHQP